ncbi:MAG: hypothetical protein HYX66_08995 [Ignavibacteria bacterium]|nr:hypothetical protein [Ignavibacteria bacterium]
MRTKKRRRKTTASATLHDGHGKQHDSFWKRLNTILKENPALTLVVSAALPILFIELHRRYVFYHDTPK